MTAAAGRVLVVDDDPDVRRYLEEFLETAGGFETEGVGDAARALAAIAAHPPDLVIVDWRLPGLSGLDLVKAIKRTWLRLPVILITGMRTDEEEIVHQAVRAGADHFLTKPLDPDEVLLLTRRMIRIRGGPHP